METRSGNDRILGDLRDNNLSGGSGNDMLNGRGGNDFLSGSSGNDPLVRDLANDTLRCGDGADTRSGGTGVDFAPYSFAFSGIVVNLWNASLNTGEAVGDVFIGIDGLIGGFSADRLTGNALNNSLQGDQGNDTLFGAAAIEPLAGGQSNDALFGGDGNEVLDGNAGRDFHHGGTAVILADTIGEFHATAEDWIDLRPIDAKESTVSNEQFLSRGTAACTGEGQARYFESGADTFVLLNTDADLAPEMMIRLVGHITLYATNILIQDPAANCGTLRTMVFPRKLGRYKTPPQDQGERGWVIKSLSSGPRETWVGKC